VGPIARHSAFVTVIGTVLGLVPRLYGLGVRNPSQDAAAIARGNAFVATADNPSAIYYNPAGITQLPGHQVRAGVLNYLGLTSEYEAPNGRRAKTEYEICPVPQFYYTFGLDSSPVSFGLGIYAPFGLGLEWPTDTGFRTLAIEGRLLYLTVNPTFAWQIHPALSVAVGPTVNYSEVELRNGIGFSPGDEFRFKGDNSAHGYHAGLLWKPHPKWAFGADYRSSTTINYTGQSEQRPYAPPVDTSVEIQFPQNFSFGISWRPTPQWNLEVAADWTDWTSVDTLTFEGAINPVSMQTIALPLNWQTSWFYHFGISREFANGFFASVGYFFSQNSTSERNFTPIVPDTDLHVGSIGGGYKGRNWQWAVAAQLITGPRRLVDESQSTSLVGESANGRYRFFVPTVSFSFGYRF
jgi:long-chain fatty acid transport protein